MKKFASLGITIALAVLFVAAPIGIEVSSVGPHISSVETAKISIQTNSAEAKSKSFSSSSKKSYGSSSSKKKSYGSSSSKKKSYGSSSSSSNSWSPDKVPAWRKTENKPSKSYTPSTATKPKTNKSTGFATNPNSSKSNTATTPVKRTAPKLTTTQRSKRLVTQERTLKSTQARTTRLQSQRKRAHSSTMYSSSREVSRARSDARYWRNRAQYERNRRWADRNMYGWGYGFYPGMTYHHGWGYWGYGYTRSGLSVVDGLILASLWDRSYYNGQPIEVNVYNQYNEQAQNSNEVMAAPQGTTISEDQQYLLVPTDDNSVESFEIPAGSTIEKTDMGILIQSPDGTTIMVPNGEDEYKPDADYEIPDYAQNQQVYAEYGSADEGNSNFWFWTTIGLIVLCGVTLVTVIKLKLI